MSLKAFAPALFFLIACIPSLFAGDTVVLDFADQATLKRIVTKGIRPSLVTNESGPALRVEAPVGNDWPSAIFLTPGGLDLPRHGYLTFRVKNPGSKALAVTCRIDSRPKGAPESAQQIRTTRISLAAGESKEVRLPLVPYTAPPNLKPTDFFGMRGIPFFGRNSMHLANITGIIFFVTKAESPCVFEVGNLRAGGEPVKADPVPEKPFPLIDQFGQFKHRDWPGKTHSVEELHTRRDEEAARLKASSRPASWDRFGGWKDGPQLDATGWFHTAKHDGKWYLVDPDGRLFFSLGIDEVGFAPGTIIDERERWFEKLPPDDPAHSAFYMSWKGTMASYHYFGKNARAFNFHKHNLMEKYGEDWQQAFFKTSAERLPVWGINTIGAFSDPRIEALHKVAYTVSISRPAPTIQGSSGYWGKFVDVFDPEFKRTLRERLKWKEYQAAKNDPWCIGYFVDNELNWGDETSLALATLVSPAEQKAKQVFVADLTAKYKTIAALNAAWKTDHASWEALLASTKAPDVAAAQSDLETFYEKIADTYFSGIREVLKEFAPHQLYLGCRYITGVVNPIAARSNARHSDVVSFNLYTRAVSDMRAELEKGGDKPYLIGEFHFGALDRGLFHTGLIPVKDQAERAQAFTEYVSECLAHPNIVGCHWFQYSDSPTTGRLWDGENFQIGFTDVCDTPYHELIEASRAVGETLYQKRTGR